MTSPGMRLYHNTVSPFVRKVMIVLIETGQADEVELVPATGNAVDTGTMPLAQNPLGKVPALERPDGPALYDSRVICRYLSDRAGGVLYPTGPTLWEALTLESTGDGILDAAVLMIYERRVRPKPLRFAPWIEGQWAKVERALDALESRWSAHLAGPFDIGQVTVGCALGYLDFRHPERDWRGGRERLAAFATRFNERPSARQSAPA